MRKRIWPSENFSDVLKSVCETKNAAQFPLPAFYHFKEGGLAMYIHVTVDLSNYDKNMLELRLSNQHTLKKVIDIAWQVAQVERRPREGFWVRVESKKTVFPGVHTLEQCNIMTGDRLKVL